MIECVKEYLSNIASELGKNIEDMDMESIERAAHIIMESEKQGGRIHVTAISHPCCLPQERVPMSCMEQRPFTDPAVR